MNRLGHVRTLAVGMAGLVVGLLAGQAGAATFDGVDYTLTYTTVDSVNAIYDVTLTIDPSNATFNQTLLKAAGFKVADPGSIEGGSSLAAAPGSWSFVANGGFNSSGCDDQNSAGFTCWQNTGSGEDIANGPFTFTARLDLDSPDRLFTDLNQASIKALYLCDSSDTSCSGLNQLSENITLTAGTTGSNEVQTGSNEVQTGSNEVQTGSNDVQTGSNDVLTGSNEVTPVPAPAPIALIGLGLAGVAVWGRMRRR